MRGEVVGVPSMKGQIFQARFAWLKVNHGVQAIERVLAALPEEERERLRGVDRDTWYPFRTLLELDRAIARELAGGDPGIYERLGEASSTDRTEWLGEHAHLVSVHGFLARAAEDHGRFHSFGRAAYRRTGFTEGELELTEFPEPDANWCRTSVGYLRGAVSHLTGGTATVAERRCQAGGAPSCLFEIRWSDRAAS